MFHFANGHSSFYGIKLSKFLFIDKQNGVLCYFLSDVILALFFQPNIIVNLLSGPHKRLVHLPLNIIVIYFSEHHRISCTYGKLALIHKHITFTVTQTLNIIMFNVFPPFLNWHFPDNYLSQWLWNDVLALNSTIELYFSWTIHTIWVTANERFSIFLRMHGISWIECDFIFFII